MIITCPNCQRTFQDEYRTTICPHETFAANDGQNNFAHHSEAHLSPAIERKSMTLNDYAAEVHQANVKWWVCLKCNDVGDFKAVGRDGSRVWVLCPYCGGTKKANRNVGELLMLSVSELAEALEGDRKDLKDDKLVHRQMFEVELADCVIRILDICGGMGLDLEGAYREKMEFNAIRKAHQREHRLSENGKKY